MKRVGTLLLILGLFGFVKLPWEAHIAKEYRAAHFYNTQFDANIRREVGTMGLAAALSGFRSVVADGLWIRANDEWSNLHWGKMKVLFDCVTTLQPRATPFWEGAAWHMAFNASVAAMNDIHEPREAIRIRRRNECFQQGVEYLLHGIEFNPDRSTLYDRLGLIYSEKQKDHCRSSWAYFEAAARPDAMPYVHRMAVYQLAACPGHEAEAYKMLVDLYNKGKNERLPTLLKLIRELQEKLNIPQEQRIDVREDLKEATPR